MTIYAVWVIAESGIPMFSLTIEEELSVDSELVAAFISAMQSFVKDSFKQEINFVTMGTITLHIREGKPHTYIIGTTADMVFDTVTMLDEVEKFFQQYSPNGAFLLPEDVQQTVENSIKDILLRHEITEARGLINPRSVPKRTFPLAAIVDSTIKRVLIDKFGHDGFDFVSYCDSKTSINILAEMVSIPIEKAIEMTNWCISEGLMVKTAQISSDVEIQPLKKKIIKDIPESQKSSPIYQYLTGKSTLEKTINEIVDNGIEIYGWSRVSAWWHRRAIKKELSTLKYRKMTGILQDHDIPTTNVFFDRLETGKDS